MKEKGRVEFVEIVEWFLWGHKCAWSVLLCWCLKLICIANDKRRIHLTTCVWNIWTGDHRPKRIRITANTANSSVERCAGIEVSPIFIFCCLSLLVFWKCFQVDVITLPCLWTICIWLHILVYKKMIIIIIKHLTKHA